MTTDMAIEYAKRWYNFSPNDYFDSVRSVVLQARKVMPSKSFTFMTRDLCMHMMLDFDCEFKEVSIED